MPCGWARIVTPALCLASRANACGRSSWHTPGPGKRSRHPASTTASHGTRSPLAANKPLAASTPLAVQTPLAQRAIEQVLLSDDILFWEILMVLTLDWLEVDGGHGMVASVCTQWADCWKALGRKLPFRVKAQRQRRAQQLLAVADQHPYRPLPLSPG